MSPQDTVFSQKIECIFNPDAAPLVMGILNITTDSFFDGGKYTSEIEWLAHTKKMIDEGAAIIDIGACSTRPGAEGISEADEIEKLVKVVKSVRKQFPEIIISADTFRAAAAVNAVEAGADIINDISGGTMDEKMFEVVSKLQVPYILMHMQGKPQTMQQNPQYENVTDEVFAFFTEKINELKALGFSKVIIDPGFGFGKTTEHNYTLLKNFNKFKLLNFPLLAGVSRKSMINILLAVKSSEALNGTSILNTIALCNGAKILRVHDVKEAVQAVKIWKYMEELN